ncbi:Hypothetical predicted protein [Mytilus galloprovincialis]|uniref:C1q domain-containing protein n=1 Tax=Mytilus galloprovincialis TaxID=29158 RepID=A0A8B6BWB0_MYTGA|nr:Hypothetical predicted protein [Mytilus galloprovincialis]
MFSENAIEKNILPRAFGQVVAFYAYMSKPQGNPGARHTLAFDVLRTNIYSGYNGATGIFTVPTSGVYIFTFTVRVICNSHFSFEIVQNGIVQGAVVVDTISQDAVCSSAHSTGTIVTPTLRGDTVLKLIKAAQEGKIEDVKLSLQNGADIEYKTVKGTTACMWASWYGHVEVIRYLLDHGSNIDTQNINGFSALMLAAANGHLGAVRLLIERRCNKEVSYITGNSVLHFSACLGNLTMTKWLVEHAGMDPSIKTSWGETPYDLARKQVHPAVTEYLQTVIPTLAEDSTDDNVPIEIKLMTDKNSVPLYLKLLESGSEKKRDIRLVIVGKKGAGKTSLLKRLFGEEIHNRELTSTNGIEIHRIRCNANSDDGKWNKLDGRVIIS